MAGGAPPPGGREALKFLQAKHPLYYTIITHHTFCAELFNMYSIKYSMAHTTHDTRSKKQTNNSAEVPRQMLLKLCKASSALLKCMIAAMPRANI